MKDLMNHLRVSLTATLSLAILLCGIYPLVVWALAQGFFPAKANGSLVFRNGALAGSGMIGQGFSDAKYFRPRPSSAGNGYDAASSAGSNLGPTSQKLADAIRQRILDYRAENALVPDTPVPADAVTASGSGLDPHISLRNALLQASRVAGARGLSLQAVHEKIRDQTEGRDFGIFGEPRVNVLMLNLALDGHRD